VVIRWIGRGNRVGSEIVCGLPSDLTAAIFVVVHFQYESPIHPPPSRHPIATASSKSEASVAGAIIVMDEMNDSRPPKRLTS
jgi:hypothetical protein